VGAIADYTSMINGKDSTISSQASQISNLTSTIDLAKSTVWVNDQTVNQSASSFTLWTYSLNNAGYAGYVSVNVQSSTTNNTYVEVIWSAYGRSAYGISYDNRITVGTSGTAVFPILPAQPSVPNYPYIQIYVGNTNLFSGATETVTITYYY
jgi:hypothetical protein